VMDWSINLNEEPTPFEYYSYGDSQNSHEASLSNGTYEVISGFGEQIFRLQTYRTDHTERSVCSHVFISYCSCFSSFRHVCGRVGNFRRIRYPTASSSSRRAWIQNRFCWSFSWCWHGLYTCGRIPQSIRSVECIVALTFLCAF
jgi:hypothetical protein